MIMDKIKEMLGSGNPEMNNLGKRLKEESDLQSRLHLPALKLIQTAHPEVMVTGSTSLYLHGLRLKRWKDGRGDLDLISPYFVDICKTPGLSIEVSQFLGGGSCYDMKYNLTNGHGQHIIDLLIDPKQPYEMIELDGFTYKVCVLETTLLAKLQLGMKGTSKHIYDVYELVGKESLRDRREALAEQLRLEQNNKYGGS